MWNLLSYARSRWASRIGVKLGTVVTLLIGGISLFIFLYFPSRLEEQATRALIDKANTTAAMTAYGLSAALYFDDQQAAHEVIRGAARNGDLVYLAALNGKGEVFAAFHLDVPGRDGTLGIGNGSAAFPETMTHRITVPIEFNGRRIGELHLAVSLAELRAEIGRMRVTIALLCLLIFLVGMLAVFGISAVLTRHLGQIADAATEVAGGNLTKRAPVLTQDEVGRLAQAFNQMVNSLESTQGELEDLNRASEERVAERTQALHQEIAERTRIEAILRNSEEYYRALIENASDIIFVLGIDGTIRFASPAVECVFGYQPQRLVNESIFDFVHPDRLTDAVKLVDQTINQPESALTFEISLRHEDGSYRLLETTARNLPGGSRVTGIVVNARDITERKQAEDALRQGEAKYRALIETTGTGFVIIDQEGKVLDANPEYVRLAGRCDLSEIYGKSVIEWTAGYEKERNAAAVEECFREGRIRNLEIDYVDANGKATPVEINATVMEIDGALRILTLCRDITERKRADERLLHFQKAVDDASDAIGMATPEGQHYYQNRAFTRLFGLSVDEVHGKVGPPSTVYADEEVGREVFAALMRGESWIGEVAMIDKDLHSIDILLRAYPITDEQGNVLGLVGVHTDITERKKSEEALRQSEGRFQQVAENAQEWIWEINGRGLYTYASPVVEKVLGYKPEEIVGKKFFYDLFYPEEREELTRAAFEAFAKKVPFSELMNRNVHKDGRVVWLQTSGVPMIDHEGKLLGYRGVDTDVTERKQAEHVRARILGRQEQLNQLQQTLLAPGEFVQKLKMITDGVVDIFSVDFCRIWVVEPGDLCELGCVHAAVTEGPHVCRRRDKCLRLRASSGRYTHTDGTVHRRVPFGCYKIGRVASEEEHRFLTNDAAHDSRVHYHDWVKDLGLVSFAGYQLRPLGGETLGVLALFSTRPITPEEDAQLDALSSTTAQVVRSARAEEALRESEEKFRRLVENLREGYFFYRHDVDGVITYISPSITNILGYSVEECLIRYTEYLTDNPINEESEQHTRLSIQGVKQPPYELEMYHKDGSVRRLEVSETPVLDEQGNVIAVEGIAHDITERKRTDETLARLAAAVEQAAESIVITSPDGTIQYVNPAFERVLGFAREDVLGKNVSILISDEDNLRFRMGLVDTIADGKIWSGRIANLKKDGSRCHQDITVAPVRDDTGAVINYVSVGRDVTQEIGLEAQLRQAQKLEAVGSLAAGIAHEINTPIQFVGDNAHFLSDSFEQLIAMVERSRSGLSLSGSGESEIGDSTETSPDSELEYLKREIPKAIADTLDGIERVAKIVRAMKEFSHPDKGEKAPVDINRALQTTLTIARNELKYVADVLTDFDENLPSVYCNLGGMNQVFLNILVNAAHAIADVVGDDSGAKGTITVSTRREDDSVVIAISDTGTGIPERARERIFDPFYTSKAVGRGTGQGLTIARSEIVDKHGGSITFDTEVGKGTTFYIRLPISAPELAEVS